MTSIATPHAELVVWEQHDGVNVAVRGPESTASPAPIPRDTTFFGIVFSLGTSMPHLPISRLVDDAVDIPDVTRTSFWLNGGTWPLPDYDNAEEFVRRMVREEVLTRDPVVAGVSTGVAPDVSERTVQRRFVTETGLAPSAVRRIDSARQAAVQIQQGERAHDVIHRLGYFDQPHLARSLTRYIGRTATQLSGPEPAEPLSLLYNT